MISESGILVPEIQFIVLLILAVIVSVAVKYVKLPYTIALLLAGILVGLSGIEEIELSQELILFVFLPALLFEGAIHIDINKLKENASIILLLSFIGLVASTLLVGYAVSYLTGIPLLFSVLFGAMIMPTDPVSVLALFKRLGVTKKLTTIVEGESLFNDGTGIVLFSVLLSLVVEGVEFDFVATVLDFAYVVLGGLGIGLILGYFAYGFLKRIDDHLIEILITGILAYGTFIIAESIHASGVMGVVAAGLFIGNRGTEFAMSPRTRISIVTSWELAAFIINSAIFILMGVRIPIASLYDNLWLVSVAILVVVLARAAVTYPLIAAFNLRSRDRIPLSWQHVVNWGGLHGSIPIALVLGLPAIEYGGELSVMVFGVVLFSLIFQGITMEPLIKRLGIITVNPKEREFEEVMARKVAVHSAKEALEEMRRKKEIPNTVYSEFSEEYEMRSEELKRLSSEKLESDDSLLEKQRKNAKRKLLEAQKSSVYESLRKGLVSEDVASELLEEVDSEIDSLNG